MTAPKLQTASQLTRRFAASIILIQTHYKQQQTRQMHKSPVIPTQTSMNSTQNAAKT